MLTLAGFSQSIPRKGSLLVCGTQRPQPQLPCTPAYHQTPPACTPVLPSAQAYPAPWPAHHSQLSPSACTHLSLPTPLFCSAPRPALTPSLPAPLFCPALQPALNPDLPHPSLPSPPACPHPQPAHIPCLPSPPACPHPQPAPTPACSHPRLPCACLDSLQFLGYYPLESSSRCQAAFTAPPQRNS